MALKLIPVSSSKEIYNCQSLSLNQKVLFLAPSPRLSDLIRSRLQNEGVHNVDCVTVFHFVGKLMELLNDDFSLTQKSELLLSLSTLFAKKFPHCSFEQFEKSYKLFSEYRSFTLDAGLIDELLDRESAEVAGAIRLFWLILENQGWVDEHQAYYQVSQKIAQAEYSLLKEDFAYQQISLWGFKHLTGVQVEFFKNLSRVVDVNVYIPREMIGFLESKHWFSWLTDISMLTEEGVVKSHHQARLYRYPRGRLSNIVSQLFEKEDFSQILLTKKALAPDYVLETLKKSSTFKVSFDFLLTSFEKVFYTIKEDLFQNSSTKKISLDNFLNFLEDKKEKACLCLDLESSFKELKILSELIKLTKEWSELSDDNIEIDEFSLSSLAMVSKLNLPRNYIIPVGASDHDKEIGFYGLGELLGMDTKQKTLVCVKKDNDYSFGESDSYSQEVSQVLSTLGPMKDKRIDYLMDKLFVDELLSNPSTVLLLEEGVEEQSLAWSETLGEQESEPLSVVQEEYKPIGNFSLDLIKDRAFKLSASSMQTYIDCPRKYLYQHLLGFGKQPRLELDFSGRILGQIEHKVIETYLEKYSSFNEDDLEKIIESLWQKSWSHIEEEILVEKDQLFFEVKHNVSHTIKSLYLLKNLEDGARVEVEKSINQSEIRGSIDFLIHFSDGFGILDFKRGRYSVPAKSQVDQFSSIQLWFYSYQYMKQQKISFDKNLFFGYLCLNSPELSKVFVRDESVAKRLLSSQFIEEENIVLFKEPLVSKLEEFSVFFSDKAEEIKRDQCFQAVPKSKSLCALCPGQLVCDRGVTS